MSGAPTRFDQKVRPGSSQPALHHLAGRDHRCRTERSPNVRTSAATPYAGKAKPAAFAAPYPPLLARPAADPRAGGERRSPHGRMWVGDHPHHSRCNRGGDDHVR